MFSRNLRCTPLWVVPTFCGPRNCERTMWTGPCILRRKQTSSSSDFFLVLKLWVSNGIRISCMVSLVIKKNLSTPSRCFKCFMVLWLAVSCKYTLQSAGNAAWVATRILTVVPHPWWWRVTYEIIIEGMYWLAVISNIRGTNYENSWTWCKLVGEFYIFSGDNHVSTSIGRV